MNDDIQELDVVSLLRDLPAEQLRAGQTGTVVYVHRGGDAFEVEFPLSPRQSVVATIEPSNLLKLRGLTAAPAIGS
jgi:hypothetical protein